MIELYLIRHGQAQSLRQNYDQLTQLGYLQAQKMGAWLVAQGYRFSEFLHGGLNRQKQTLEAIAAGFASKGEAAPEKKFHSAFAEFEPKVWATLAKSLRHGHPEFAALLRKWNRARHENALGKEDIFQSLTGIILREWALLGKRFSAAESFPAFRARVLTALNFHSYAGCDIMPAMENPSTGQSTAMEKRRLLAVTSAGPIAILVGTVLGLSADNYLSLTRRIYNSSLHVLVSEGRGWELKTFDSVPHLKESECTVV